MSTEKLLEKVTACVGRMKISDAPSTEIADNLILIHSQETTSLKPDIYSPVLCLILQGRKETRIGNHIIEFGAGESLIVSHTSSVQSRITEASTQKPYLALVLVLDIGLLRSLHSEMVAATSGPVATRALALGRPDDQLNDALFRFVSLVEHPLDYKILAPSVLREIYFILLMAEHGAMLRQLITRDSHAHRIAKAINFIQENFDKSLSVADAAAVAGMSVSSFHEHFRSITMSTPLQYQKDLRLFEAQQRLKFQGQSVSEAAYAVGYESTTQFSREYSRKYGLPPSEDRRSDW